MVKNRSMVKKISTHRRHPMAAFVVMVLGLIVCGFVYAAAAPGPKASASTDISEEVAQGRELYVAGCATCHGLSGEGSEQAPTLIGVGPAAVDFQVGTGRMPLANQGPQAPQKPPIYTEEQVQALAAYVASLGPGPAIPSEDMLDTSGLSDDEIAKGGSLFRTNCSACHNFAGQGGALTEGKYAPKVANTEAKYIYEAMITGPQSMPVFPDSTITEQDKKQIIAYLHSLNDEPDHGGSGIGRLGPVSEGLYGWLVGMGALMIVAIWIGAKQK
jgi:ubiquinol-cytochrome c reductase cytochrome c subunit